MRVGDEASNDGAEPRRADDQRATSRQTRGAPRRWLQRSSAFQGSSIKNLRSDSTLSDNLVTTGPPRRGLTQLLCGPAASPGTAPQKTKSNHSSSLMHANLMSADQRRLAVKNFRANSGSPGGPDAAERELTDRRALTCQSFKTPRHQSQAQTAVRCSDLLRRRALHTQKSLVKSVPTRSDDRPSHCAPTPNSLRRSAISAASALKIQTQTRRERKDSLRKRNTKNSASSLPTNGCRRTIYLR